MSNRDWILKIAILGDTSVGKTALVTKFIEDSFREDYRETMGVNIMVKTITINNSRIRLILWDIAGQETYRATRDKYFQGCNGALFVYDITRYSSFANIEEIWLKDYYTFVEDNRVFVLIGNKSDLTNERGVEMDAGNELSERIDAAQFLETSAKNGTNVDEAFTILVKEIFKRKEMTI